MAWKDTLFDASFRQVPFECTSANESRAKSVVVSQPPYSDKAFVSDMGNDARRYTITAFIEGEDYEIYRDNLIIALDMRGAGELVHPLYGSLNVQVMDYSIKQDSESVDSCTIDISFIAAISASDTQSLFLPVAIPPVSEQAPAIILEQPSAALETYQEQLEQISNPEAVAVARSIPEKVRAEIRRVREILQVNTQQVNDLFSPPDWINGIINDTIGLMNDIPLDADPVANWRRVINRIKSIGDMFADTDIAPLRMVGVVLPAAMQAQSMIDLIVTDSELQSINPIELINANNVVRQTINDTIAIVRRIEPEPDVGINMPKIIIDTRNQVATLKKAAAQLQKLTNDAVNKKPPLIQYTVKRATTLRLLAHRLYGDHSRADELLTLNKDLVNPGLVQAGTRLNIYANWPKHISWYAIDWRTD